MEIEEEIRKAAINFCETFIKPHESEIEQSGLYIDEILKELGSLGYMGISIPKEFGGLGLPFEIGVNISIILSKYNGTIASILGASQLAALAIEIAGSTEQKETYLSELAKGKIIGSFALTEPEAGSDPSSIKTTAQKIDEGYILNGTKAFITNAGLASVYAVMAKTEPGAGARGISAFIINKSDTGFSVGRREHKMALDFLPNSALSFNDVVIPKNRLIGREGSGFITAMKVLEIGRIFTAAGAVGLSERALEEATIYSKRRMQGGQPIANFQMIQSYLADMATETEASKMLVINAARLKDKGDKKSQTYSSMAKYYSSKTAVDVARLAVQIFGGYGWVKDYVVERLYREAKMYEIVEGTSEIQKLIIANNLLKERK
ncbi:MAG: acyl-CoA dehydrogenase family protein [Caldisericaceae bacterium]